MSGAHLLLISLGPVQDFIAQARRTRDLWFGSHLLSEISRAAAAKLAHTDADLIFPALKKGDTELEECDSPTRLDGTPPLSIANKILARLPPGVDPAVCGRAARDAVKDRWRRIAGKVRAGRGTVLAKNIDDVWYEQIDDIVEFYAVWVPLDADYPKARNAAEQALAGRKNLRDFRPWSAHRDGAPKSSLDGARVSVLPKNEDRDLPAFRRFGIRAGEQLDAVGLVKRTGFAPDQFIPLVNVAAGDWVRRAEQTNGELLTKTAITCGPKKIPAIKRDLKVIKPFRFDASVLYPSRWPTLFSELEDAEDAIAARAWGEDNIRPLLKAMKGEPPSYVACLVADGDHMGKAIDTLKWPEDNQAFSRALAKFPGQARTIVEDDHLGSLVYAGGDDVLAFLPVATAVFCAKALADAFHAALKDIVPVGTPTLSVGIGIGHVLDPMASLLQLGRDAERAAKDSGRNALAVIADKRSGGQRRFAQSWKCDPAKNIREPLVRIQLDMELVEEKLLSTGKVHALEALLDRFPKPDAREFDPESAAAAFVGYANDLLRHTGEGNANISLDSLGVARGLEYAKLRAAVRDTIDRVLTVRLMREAGFNGKAG